MSISFDIPKDGRLNKYAKLVNMANHGKGQEKINAQNMLKKMFLTLPEV